MKRAFLMITIFLLVVFVAQSAWAVGALFTRPLRSTQDYQKMWIKSVDATFAIDGQVAVTHVDQVFHNEMNQLVEGIYIFPLPEGAMITELIYWFNGIQYRADIRERQAAVADYQNKIRQFLDPALLEYLGNNMFRLSIAPINANSDVRTEITYVELLPYEFGAIDYKFLLNTTALSVKPLLRVSVTGEIKASNPIKYVRSASHVASTKFSISKIDAKKYVVTFGDENFFPDRDLLLQYETERADIDLNVLTYTPTVADSMGNDSFYAVWVTPPDTIDQGKTIPKKIVFTADISSSMDGDRLDQLKQALLAFLDHLTPIDYFNIITFGTTIVPYQPNLVPASSQEVDAARQFVQVLGAAGLTNISQALIQSLAQSFSNDYANSIVFFTDGYPTWGQTSIPAILDSVRAHNKLDVSIFAFGVGDDISPALLQQLASENFGYFTFIKADQDIANAVKNHFQRISQPILTHINLNMGGLVVSDRFPRPLQDLFWGNQVMQLGLYMNSGNYPVTLEAKIRGNPVSYSANADFARIPGMGHRFIPRLWARAKIDYLLGQIQIYGELNELVNQIVQLSLRFQILTPYTAFYSDPTSAAEDPPRVVQPHELELFANYPNPFNPETTIRYRLPVTGQVVIKVYDITGRLVKTLINAVQSAGLQTIQWDGTDQDGVAVAAGVYIYQLEFSAPGGGRWVLSRKMSLVR